MTYAEIANDYKIRADAERAAGGKIEIDSLMSFISLILSDDSKYTFQGSAADELLREADEFCEKAWSAGVTITLSDIILAQAQNW